MTGRIRGRSGHCGIARTRVTHGPTALSGDCLTTGGGGATALAKSKSTRRTLGGVGGRHTDGLSRGLVTVALAVVGRRAGLLLSSGFASRNSDTPTVGPSTVTACRTVRSCSVIVKISCTILLCTTVVLSIGIYSLSFTGNFPRTTGILPLAPIVGVATCLSVTALRFARRCITVVFTIVCSSACSCLCTTSAGCTAATPPTPVAVTASRTFRSISAGILSADLISISPARSPLPTAAV